MKMEQKLKRRFADGRANTSILKSKCKNMYINNKEFVGNISLLQIEEVKEEWRVDIEERCILAKGYYWLEIYPENKNCCITAIFNNNKEIVEWYIDIARNLGVQDGIPYEDDLYLDVVIVHDGRIHLLDEDELEQAYKQKIISKKDYELAYEKANKIIEFAKANLENLKSFSYKYLKLIEK